MPIFAEAYERKDYEFMKKTTALLLVMVIVCTALVGCSEPPTINSGKKDILYNDIVYERCDGYNFNLQFYEDNAHYIGDFMESYNFGQQLPWPVNVLNSEENVLYSSSATWVKPGYSLPDNFGVAFSSVEYVVSEGLDFLIMEDNYVEEATLLATFDSVVMLEDIVEAEASEIAECTLYDDIRFRYVDYADMASIYTIGSHDGKYYLNVCQSPYGDTEWHEIKAEYVELLTAPIGKAK